MTSESQAVAPLEDKSFAAENSLGTPVDTFIHRHLGPSDDQAKRMLAVLGYQTLDELTDATIPARIRSQAPLALGQPRGENELLKELASIASQNKPFRSLIGQGYYDTITPPIIARNILENPGWYTQYTPYQAEISQGRLEALLNFQTLVADLTALPMANASMLDEPTAAAEAMAMCRAISRDKKNAFFVTDQCHPQTINVVKTRARSMGIELIVGKTSEIDFTNNNISGILIQYPATTGEILAPTELVNQAHDAGMLVVAATDLLALTLITPPGECGVDIAVGSAQRFGVPLGFGGPHAAYIATSEKYVRKMPGRLIGVSKDSAGNPAYRLAIQTREQHIKRDRATSNICTAQALLAIMAAMYATYHGPGGLKQIAQRIHDLTTLLAAGLSKLGYDTPDAPFFDTLTVTADAKTAAAISAGCLAREINLRQAGTTTLGISLDEQSTLSEVRILLDIFAQAASKPAPGINELADNLDTQYPANLTRSSEYLTHPVFNSYHCETDLLRYIHRLQSKDLSLTTAMIPLGSCTMKLNATSEMLPVSWPTFTSIHPYAPADQVKGYQCLCDEMEYWLARITGFAAVSLQPNAGSQGEYAGLLAITGYHHANNESHRNVCLIPVSAHGTNPASAVTAGMKVVAVNCDKHGNIDVDHLRQQAEKHRDNLAALMITYPSTHGVFEQAVQEICQIIHDCGGQVYMDGANMNAMVGLSTPAAIGADVCHLNLHKTFAIPHGGGGPGMGPIAVAKHLQPYLPSDPLGNDNPDPANFGPVSAANYGSASILPISWMYMKLMGDQGLTKATQTAILSANYMAKRLEDHYPILYTGIGGRVAHEFIIDCRQFNVSASVSAEDIAKRLMDYGFHAPTMSWPVANTLMVEPTESEPLSELDRFCDAMIAIREEIREIELGKSDIEDNPLKNAPHTAMAVSAIVWPHPYSRQQAAYPYPASYEYKFWPAVGRIDNPYGDRNLVCTCPSVSELAE